MSNIIKTNIVLAKTDATVFPEVNAAMVAADYYLASHAGHVAEVAPAGDGRWVVAVLIPDLDNGVFLKVEYAAPAAAAADEQDDSEQNEPKTLAELELSFKRTASGKGWSVDVDSAAVRRSDGSLVGVLTFGTLPVESQIYLARLGFRTAMFQAGTNAKTESSYSKAFVSKVLRIADGRPAASPASAAPAGDDLRSIMREIFGEHIRQVITAKYGPKPRSNRSGAEAWTTFFNAALDAYMASKKYRALAWAEVERRARLHAELSDDDLLANVE